MNMSYILTSHAGKVWATDQLDSIARRFMPRSARRIAHRVRENLSSTSESVKVLEPMVLPLPTPIPPTIAISDQSKLVVSPFITSSPTSIGADGHYLYTGGSTSSMGTQSQDKVGEHAVYQHDPHGWSEM